MRTRLPKPSPLLLLALAACGHSDVGAPPMRSPAEFGQVTQAASSAPSHVTLRPQKEASLCLSVRGGEDEGGAAVELATCDGSKGQLWQRRGKHLVVFADKCLNVTEGENTDGTHLQIWPCKDGDTNSDWRPGLEQFAWDNDPSKCLDVTDGAYSPGTPLQIWTCNAPGENVNQAFGWTYEVAAEVAANAAEAASGQASTAPAAAGGGAPVASKPAVSKPVASKPAANKPADNKGAATAPVKAPAPAAQKPATKSPTSATQSTKPPTGKAPAPAAKAAHSLRVGIHIDYDNGSTGGVAGFIKRTGITPAMTAGYVRCKTDGSFESGQAKNYIDEAANNGVAAVSLAVTSEIGGKLSQQQLDGLRSAVAYGVGKKLSVEIRFGYEMNGNWSPSFHNNDTSVFLGQWAQVAAVVHAAKGLMVWSPNNNWGKTADYERWLPKDMATVDKMALDFYHKDDAAIADDEIGKAIGLVYALCSKYNKPFYFGETAVTVRDGDFSAKPGSKGVAMKKAWLDQLVSDKLQQAYPLYEGFVWFDYNKTESDTGLAGGNVTRNRFTISQDPTDAAMYKAWKLAHPNVR